jgi:hypothetical protein
METPGPISDLEQFDDSGALSILGMAVGALFGYVEKHDAENCEYLAFIALQAGDSTPAPSYQGTYERISKNLDLIAAQCLIDLDSTGAVNLAILTRKDVTAILDDRNYLGGSDWGKPEPVSGAQK